MILPVFRPVRQRARPPAVWIFLLFFGSVAAEAGTHTWTGANSQLWSDDGNWVGGSPGSDPSPDLIFPGDALSLASTDDLPGATPVRSIQFTGSGYILDAVDSSSIALLGGIDVAPNGGAIIALPIVLSGTTGGSSRVVTTYQGTRLELSGPIRKEAGNYLQIYGDGTVVLSGTVGAGVHVGRTQPSFPAFVLIDGSQLMSEVTIDSGTLGGNGTTGSIIIVGPFFSYGSVAAIRPGGEANPGILNVEGFVTMKANPAANRFRVRLNGPTPGSDYDQLNVSGALQLENPRPGYLPVRLEISLGFVPQIGDSFTVISCRGGVTGNFDVGPDGSTFTVQDVTFQINYTADSVILTRVA